MRTLHGGQAPSAWIRRWSHLVPTGATVLDVACGSGRHVRWFAGRGCRVTAVDRDAAAVAPLTDQAEVIVADLEGSAWPLDGRRFDAVVVTNYLWRERWPDLVASLAPGGLLIYETFSAGHETIGKPSNPAFVLQSGELLRMSGGLRVVAFEEVFEAAAPRYVQRIVAASQRLTQTLAIRRFEGASEPTSPQLKSCDSEDPA